MYSNWQPKLENGLGLPHAAEQGQKDQTKKIKQLIEEEYGDCNVAVPFVSKNPLSLYLQTGLPRLLKT